MIKLLLGWCQIWNWCSQVAVQESSQIYCGFRPSFYYMHTTCLKRRITRNIITFQSLLFRPVVGVGVFRWKAQVVVDAAGVFFLTRNVIVLLLQPRKYRCKWSISNTLLLLVTRAGIRVIFQKRNPVERESVDHCPPGWLWIKLCSGRYRGRYRTPILGSMDSFLGF